MFKKIGYYRNVLSVTSNEAVKTDAERAKPNINNGNVKQYRWITICVNKLKVCRATFI